MRENAMRVKLPKQVADIYRAVQELEADYPGRKFTPDGHLVGSIGEVIAAQALDLELHPPSHPRHGARGADGCDVQIKLTSGRSDSLYSTCDRLLVLKVNRSWGSGGTGLKDEGEIRVQSTRPQRCWLVSHRLPWREPPSRQLPVRLLRS